MAAGTSGKAAFEQISAEIGISAGTVQAAFYRAGHKSGIITARPRGGKVAPTAPPKKRGRPVGSKSAPKAAARPAPAPAPAAAPTVSVAAKLDQVARLLAEVAADVRALEADAANWRAVSKLVKG